MKQRSGDGTGKRPASQWYWADWLRDPAVRASSLEARGLWVDMLALMHEGQPYGHLTVGGESVTEPQLARMVGESPARVRRLLAELEKNGVFSRTDAGTIYSRRMVRDEHIRNIRAQAGKLGGNPNLIVGAKDNPEVGRLDNQTDKQKPTPSSSTAAAASSAKDLRSDSGRVDTGPGTARDRFLARFYADAAPERRAEIARQLDQLLQPEGLRASRNLVVRATGPEHLNKALLDVLRGTPIRNPDRAIWVLFRKLADATQAPGKTTTTDAIAHREKEQRELEERYQLEAKQAGTRWANDHLDEYGRISASVNANLPASGGEWTKAARDAQLSQRLAKAAGFPDFETWLERQEVTA